MLSGLVPTTKPDGSTLASLSGVWPAERYHDPRRCRDRPQPVTTQHLGIDHIAHVLFRSSGSKYRRSLVS